MWALMRPLLFALSPERAHGVALRSLQAAGAFPPLRGLMGLLYRAPERPVEVLGLSFRNPIGLAAGWDKDAKALRGLPALGFGHVEIGTVTPRPQPGNPRPRVFRLSRERCLVNRRGFPSDGAVRVAARLARRPRGLVVGVNLGRNKDTPTERAHDDYAALLERFAPLADYLVVNVSSPNTPGLRDLQARGELEALLAGLVARRDTLDVRPPLLVKLSPDLAPAALDDALEAVHAARIDGIVATNTTLARDGLAIDEAGGASGLILQTRGLDVVRRIATLAPGLPLIAAGGVMGPDDVRRRLDVGASLVQVYTGLVFAGPGIVRRMARA
jgi:dihydroorotate dehydrogenase